MQLAALNMVENHAQIDEECSRDSLMQLAALRILRKITSDIVTV